MRRNMNIKFKEIFSLTITQVKNDWKKLLTKSLLMLLFNFCVYISVLLIIGVPTILLFAIFNSIGGLAVSIFSLIMLVIIMVIIYGITFVPFTSSYISAISALEDRGLFECIKSVYTLSNFKFFLKRVCIPIIMSNVGIAVLAVLGSALIPALAMFFSVIALVMLIVSVLFFYGNFVISLYSGEDIETSNKLLLQKFTKKDIFKAYLIKFTISFVLLMAYSLFMLIPIVAVIAQFFIVYVCNGALVQAMIIKVSGRKPKSKIKSRINPFTTNQNITLQNDDAKVVINSFGAEIKSFKCDGKEYMWQTDSEYLDSTAPILFPFAGKLKDDKYMAGEKVIEMNQHGFLCNREFKVTDETANSVTFTYSSTLADFELYPCDFSVEVSYQLIGRELTTSYNVINNSSYKIPYQIGGHPAFNVDSVDDLTVLFPQQNVTKYHFKGGLQTSTEQVGIGQLDLSYDLINRNQQCYSNFTTRELVLQNKGRDFIKLKFGSMDYLTIWSPEYKSAKLICIAPCNGISSHVDQQGYSLENKEGMYYIAPNASRSCTYSFEIC